MGYSADLILATDAMRITDADRVLAELDACQHRHPGGHISWCQPVATYGPGPDGLAALLTSFGFEATAYPNHVLVHGWQGSKIGSSFGAVLDALALGIVNHVRWKYEGEDGLVWVEHLAPCWHRTAEVRAASGVSRNGCPYCS
jgi:hypothetical protein